MIARKALWEHGLDYAHGTGHGYGCCLGVHEGPTLISTRSAKLGKYFETPLVPGMTVTNGSLSLPLPLWILFKE